MGQPAAARPDAASPAATADPVTAPMTTTRLRASPPDTTVGTASLRRTRLLHVPAPSDARPHGPELDAAGLRAGRPAHLGSDGPVLAWTAALALLQVSLETVLYLGLAAAVGRASAWFRRPRVRRRLEAASGTVLIGLGVRVQATSR